MPTPGPQMVICHRKLDHRESDLQTPEGTVEEATGSGRWHGRDYGGNPRLKTSPAQLRLHLRGRAHRSL